jgi:hypothetical protein
MTAEQLYSQFTAFGPDPYIMGSGPEASIQFSGWDYAKKRCAEICAIAPPSNAKARRIFKPYYELKRSPITCPVCRWSGTGQDLALGEVFEGSAVIEYQCPVCAFDIAFTAGPTGAEAAAESATAQPAQIVTPASPPTFLAHAVRPGFWYALIATYALLAALLIAAVLH